MKKWQKATEKSQLMEKLGIENIEKVLQERKEELRRIYGKKFLKLILYGSYARAEAWDGYDIDMVVLLDGEVSPPKVAQKVAQRGRAAFSARFQFRSMFMRS
jgi:predicted nucleotidyltransferase